jgi:hypothetical protein
MFKAPMIPRIEDAATKEASDEIARVAVGLKNKIAHGVLTDVVTVPANGVNFSIEHKLGRKPTGWILCNILNYAPEIRVLSVDEKRINMRSAATTIPTSTLAFWVW